MITPLSNRRGAGGEASVGCWVMGVVCEVTPIGLLAWGVVRFFSHAGEFFLSQSAQSSRSFLAHSLSPQNAFGIQRTQRPHPQPLSEWRGE